MPLVELSKIDFNTIEFAPNKSKSQRVFLKVFSDKKECVFKIPKSKIPFNASKNNYGQVEVCLSISKKYSEYFEKMDQTAKALLKKAKPDNDYEFLPTLKQSNPSFDPLFKFKIFKSDDKFPDIYDSDKNHVNITSEDDIMLHFKKRNEALCAIEWTGLWIMENRCGLSFKLVQGRIFDTVSEPQEDDYLFDDSGSSENDYLFDD